jgi:antitoxin HicB
MTTRHDCRFQIRPLIEEEGGGYPIEFPDLPGCLSDGATIEAAIANGADACAPESRPPGNSAIRFRRPHAHPTTPTAAAGTCACRDRCTAALPSAPKPRASV